VHNGRSVHFRETWLDERANMLRLPGIVACAVNRDVLQTLAKLARDWNPNRYTD
jgi:3'(2'), 5'-bisphosphate nucleotidase